MVTKYNFENKTTSILNVVVEPAAVSFDLEPGKAIEIELTQEFGQLTEKLEVVLENGRLIIYQNRSEMRIYIDNELQF